MNIIERIDEVILDSVKNVSSFVQRLVGLNNFSQARIAIFVATVLGITDIFMESTFIFKLVFDIVLTLAVFFSIFRTIGRVELVQKPQFKNPLREMTLAFVFRYLLYGLFFLYLVYPISVLLNGRMFFLVIAICLMSIEPDSPSQSKLEKFVNRLRSFGRTPLPSPT